MLHLTKCSEKRNRVAFVNPEIKYYEFDHSCPYLFTSSRIHAPNYAVE